MDKVWLKSYPPGVPVEVDLSEFKSLDGLFEMSCRKYAGRTAYVNMDRGISYADLDRLTAQFAGYLQSELKLAKGSRVALMMPTLLPYPVCMFGVLRAG